MTGMQARVQDGGESSEPFSVSNGVKQGCFFAPTLFNLMFSAMLIDTITSKSASDGVLAAPSSASGDCKRRPRFNLTLSTTICSPMIAPSTLPRRLTCSVALTGSPMPATTSASRSVHDQPNITIIDQQFNAVDKFIYLGSTFSRNFVIDDEVNARLAKVSVAFDRLYKNVWNRTGITIGTKIKVYSAVIITTLLYGCEAWTVYQRHVRKLNNFHTTCLRKLLSIKSKEKIPDEEVLTRAGLPSVYTMLMKLQLRWAGYVVRMPDHRLPKKILFGELQEDSRSRGAPKTRSMDRLKVSLKSFSIDHDSWEAVA